MMLWAVIEIIVISKREGVWIKSASPGWGTDAANLLITAAVVALVVYIHPWLSGMPVW